MACVVQKDVLPGVRTWCERDITLRSHEWRYSVDELLAFPRDTVCEACYRAVQQTWSRNRPPEPPEPIYGGGLGIRDAILPSLGSVVALVSVMLIPVLGHQTALYGMIAAAVLVFAGLLYMRRTISKTDSEFQKTLAVWREDYEKWQKEHCGNSRSS